MDVLTREGTKYTLSKKMYRQSILLRDLAEQFTIPEEGVKILVDSDVFKWVQDFMNNHLEDQAVEEVESANLKFNDSDEKFFLLIEDAMLFRVASTANYLNMPLLLEMCCSKIADSLKEKSTEEIKKYLKIPEETIKNEINVQKEYKWIE